MVEDNPPRYRREEDNNSITELDLESKLQEMASDPDLMEMQCYMQKNGRTCQPWRSRRTKYPRSKN